MLVDNRCESLNRHLAPSRKQEKHILANHFCLSFSLFLYLTLLLCRWCRHLITRPVRDSVLAPSVWVDLYDELDGKRHPGWIKTSKDRLRPPGQFQILLREKHIYNKSRNTLKASWEEGKWCLDQQIWADNLVFVSSL